LKAKERELESSINAESRGEIKREGSLVEERYRKRGRVNEIEKKLWKNKGRDINSNYKERN
jgi:hypothetical protein